MFQSNKYSITYYNIIHNAQSRVATPTGYFEKHHIIPKSLGGSDSPSNLVLLTAREHFVCHLLLPKFTTGDAKRKMSYAAHMLLNIKRDCQIRYVPSSRIYEMVKKEFIKTHRERFTGRKLSDDQKAQISSAHKGIPESKESNLKRSIALKGIPKGPMSEETKKKLSKSKKGKPSKNKGGTTSLKGMTYEEIHGEEKAKQLKNDRSKKLKNRTVSNETKQHWSNVRKGKGIGGDNPNAKPIVVNGAEYPSKKDACEALKISAYLLSKLIKITS